MPDESFHELLGDDGEFIEPVDSNFGVYPAYRYPYRWRLPVAVLGLFACAMLAVTLWHF